MSRPSPGHLGRRASPVRALWRWSAVLGLQPPRHGAWSRHDRELHRLLRDAPAAVATYRWIFRYLLTGFLEWRSEGGARAHYPGVRSSGRFNADSLEGFSRFLPLAAAWLSGGRPALVEDLAGRRVDLPALLAEGLAAGSDPGHPEFWRESVDRDQRQVEAADIALGLWLGRETLWPRLDSGQRQRLGAWLARCAARPVWDNNWRVFPLLVNAVLAALGLPAQRGGDAAHREGLRALHRGDGWFCDGEAWRLDHYNAWGFHYALPWLARIEPGADGGLVERTLPDFARSLAHLLSPAGAVLLGRSLHYRLALPGPLIAAQRLWPAQVPPGLARRALAAVWARYGRAGALRAGVVTQGVEGLSLPLLDAYAGPASPLWSLRSLVLALAEPDAAPLWQAPLQPLPVERGDFAMTLPALGWRIEGRCADGEIVLHRDGEVRAARFERGGLVPRWRLARRRPPGLPDNLDSRYFRASYSVLRPFWQD